MLTFILKISWFFAKLCAYFDLIVSWLTTKLRSHLFWLQLNCSQILLTFDFLTPTRQKSESFDYSRFFSSPISLVLRIIGAISWKFPLPVLDDWFVTALPITGNWTRNPEVPINNLSFSNELGKRKRIINEKGSLPLLIFLHIVWKSPKMSHLKFSILAFSTNFCPIKLTCLVTLFDRKLQVFKNSPKWTIIGIFS